MKHRILWTVGVLGILALALAVRPTEAQRGGAGGIGGGGMGFGFGAPAGRFAIAHASAEQVLVLDTATGKVYKAGKDDFKKMSELPKVEGGMPFPDLKDRPRKEREKEGDRPRRGEDGKAREKSKQKVDDPDTANIERIQKQIEALKEQIAAEKRRQELLEKKK